ncbi:ABC-2 type transport system permease protein [Lentzea waywayandensis]|uniref:Transport permease protein n=1 Tax=Lentzea waywayandensis TaxID=84724 RepID=A0A1I6FJR2_9PSEU|nr:ABC transporter permease [Lentzea waywayandensis]SFR30165.1 ABC-2 type transport system permease protein [Lentzea waywayandensis]
MILRDTWLIYTNELMQRKRQILWLVLGLFQPLLYLFAYGPLVTKLMSSFWHTNTWDTFLPALLLQAALTQSMFAGLTLLWEKRMGVVERFRVAPISRYALVFGKLGAIGTTTALLSFFVAMICRSFFALNSNMVNIAVCVLFNVLLSMFVAACSYALALRVNNEETLSPALNALLLPLLLLSGAFIPITKDSSPGWLQQVSLFNPITYIMDADRAILRGNYFDSNAVIGTAVLLGLGFFSITWVARAFTHESA